MNDLLAQKVDKKTKTFSPVSIYADRIQTPFAKPESFTVPEIKFTSLQKE